MSSEEGLSCSICQEIFKNPVLLFCGHSFCKECLRSWWRQKPSQECPVCKRRSSRSDPPQNLALRNLCEAFVQQRNLKTSGEQVCEVHSERLKLFCLTDQQPVCVVCRDSKVHEDHRFRPIEEAAQDLRDELDKSLQPLKKNLQEYGDLKKELEKADHIKNQFHQTERQIQAEFKKLHQFLVEEEESRLKALREEEQQKTQRMKDKMSAVNREIEALSETIRATEEQLRAPDVSFLLKYKAAVERVQRCPLLEKELKLPSGDLIEQAKHLGNLTFNIWTSMHSLVQFTPVILDPNMGKNVVLSDDLTSFTFDKKETERDLEDHKEGGVFGSEWFDSGYHMWEVEVGNNEEWCVGVTTDPFEEDVGNLERWCIVFSNNKYRAEHKERDISLKLDSKPERVKVKLDCDDHKVSFSDADTDTQIHTFTKISRKKLLPLFYSTSKCPIRILPQQTASPDSCVIL